ncbi:DUF1415 domain-containing protein [Methylomarinum sp. Ch1-1]|uniref:DUF1415 domain-containing protein n=1 Tax=Methylomarinum roseum TaxID=3067653 RepID=A0AAU7NVF6_9GAMM|nr:DUF1415 domain-containing protein [Methylomarinum sp. Ch1-1]MDP4519345.1 DUF1415 domain-containing protein [Methylomarinum sp. Ch1-1]
MNPDLVVASTREWLKSFIIDYNICPFARREYERNRIRYAVVEDLDWGDCLTRLVGECHILDTDPDTETTLIIFPQTLHDFDAYLDFLGLAERLLVDQGYEGVYQLASFHPHYRFADSDDKDPANYTNRSPYPMLHLIREASIEQALRHYPHPENIPERNIRLTRQMGLDKLQRLLQQCRQTAAKRDNSETQS